MKSGFPGKGGCLRQPLIPWARRIEANFSSVALLPFDRMAAMTCERFSFEKTSVIDSQAHFTEIVSLLNIRREIKSASKASNRSFAHSSAFI
jgi:hypothetical protein